MDHWSDATWRGRAGQPTLRAVSGHAVRLLPRPDASQHNPLPNDQFPTDDLPRHPSLLSPVLTDDDSAGIRVLVVGDDVLARRGVLAALDGETGMVVVGEHSTGPAIVNSLTQRQPDVLLLHGLHVGDAAPMLATVRESVRRTGRVVRVLGIGVRDDESVLAADGPADDLSGEPAGIACGWLPAWATPEEVVAAVRIAAAGFMLVRADGPATLARADEATRGRHVAVRDGLSDRECDVLALVARGLSNAEIAETLTVSEHTVKSHMQNLLGQLGLRNRIHAVIYAFDTGLVTADRAAKR